MHDVLFLGLLGLAGLLGAAVLAIVLIYRAQQKQGAMITQMRAEATAQKIAALTQRQQPLPEESEAPEPVRRKRHLGLYIGGGVVAVIASFGRRLRSAVTRSPRNVVAATATVAALAGTATALIMGASDNGPAPEGPGPTHPTTAPDNAVQDAADGTDAETDDNLAYTNTTDDRPLTDTSSPTTDHAPSPETSPDADTTPTASASDSGATPDAAPTSSAATPPPVAPDPDPTSAVPAPDPQPSVPDDNQDSGGLICLNAPKLVDLCLLGD
ncbi:hypothetical protein [Streptomyces sp. TE5632]